jgi:nucleotide-binding universal stress UspA family protein
MNVLIAVKGGEDETFFHRVATVAPLQQAEAILLAHVIDPGLRADLEIGRERYLGHRPMSAGRSADLTRAEEERAAAVLRFARHALIAAGASDGRIREVTLRGKPNEELRRLAEREGADLIVVGGRPGKPGPHSLGKTARFLVDHAPAAALLVR